MRISVWRPFTFLAAALMLSLVTPTARAGEVTFVSNDKELNAALEAAAQGTVRHVAVNQEFYLGSAKQTKDRIRGLLATTIELGDRIVYMYGTNFNSQLSQEIIGTDGKGCTPPYMAGKYYRANFPDDPVRICGAMRNADEISMRETIEQNVVVVKRDFQYRK
jgi:hypothetical protein